MLFLTVVHLSCICLFKSKSCSWFQTYDWDGNALLFMVFMMPMFPVPWIELFTECDILDPTENFMTGHALAVISGYISWYFTTVKLVIDRISQLWGLLAYGVSIFQSISGFSAGKIALLTLRRCGQHVQWKCFKCLCRRIAQLSPLGTHWELAEGLNIQWLPWITWSLCNGLIKYKWPWYRREILV